jgi:hypothetical protein
MFDRKAQFDRSFFDRILSGIKLPARIAGKFTIAKRTSAFIIATRTDPFSISVRTNPFIVVASV